MEAEIGANTISFGERPFEQGRGGQLCTTRDLQDRWLKRLPNGIDILTTCNACLFLPSAQALHERQHFAGLQKLKFDVKEPRCKDVCRANNSFDHRQIQQECTN